MKTILLSLLAVSLAACGGGVEAYNDNLRKISDTIAYAGRQSAYVVDRYETVWAEAIDSRGDFNTAMAAERSEQEGMRKSIVEHKTWVDSALKTVQDDIPKESVDKQKKVMELYGVVGRLTSLADQPEGNLMAFRNEINGLAAEFQKLESEMRIMNILSPPVESK